MYLDWRRGRGRFAAKVAVDMSPRVVGKDNDA